jgi:GNAT superfamily N-acetyltransferase
MELNKVYYTLCKDKNRNAEINTLFAMAVLEGNVEGKVIVDQVEEPSLIYIKHPYGMSLLLGEVENLEFNDWIINEMLNKNHNRNTYEWLQVYPASLNNKLKDILHNNILEYKTTQEDDLSIVNQDKIIEYERINFSFVLERNLDFKRNQSKKHTKELVIQTNREIFEQLKGSVIPKYFWNNTDDFMNLGIGFTLLKENIPVSTAFSSVIFENKIEIGIETMQGYQGSGYATLVCSKLIDYCLENGYEPVWSCNSSNTLSKKLAERLGFVESKRLSYYRLPR